MTPVSLSAKTLFSIVEDVYDSISRSGLKSLVLLNGHGGNYVLSNIVQEGSAKGQKLALFPTNEDWKDARSMTGLSSSILLHTYPDLLRPGFETSDHTHDDRRHLLTVGMAAYTETGVIGRPPLGAADKGKSILESLVTSFADVVNLLRSTEQGQS